MRAHRTARQMRPVTIDYNTLSYADGSVIYTCGRTKVLCAVTLQKGVPPFLKGTRTGWLTAHYAMLPTSCHNRVERESKTGKPNGRFVELSRIIGRCLRTVVDLKPLGEYTIVVDCDVLQADGGTRTAAVSGASLALQLAQEKWLAQELIARPIVRDQIAAVSVGLKGDELLVDLDYQEDSTVDADFNFIFSKSGHLIEVQGTAEQTPITMQQFQHACSEAQGAVVNLFDVLDHERKVNEHAQHMYGEAAEQSPHA